LEDQETSDSCGRPALFYSDSKGDQAANEDYRLPLDCTISLLDVEDTFEDHTCRAREKGKGERDTRDSETEGSSEDQDRQISLAVSDTVPFRTGHQDKIRCQAEAWNIR
jgi:hypothetical protein